MTVFQPSGASDRTASNPVASAARVRLSRGRPPILSRIVPGASVGDCGTQEMVLLHEAGETSDSGRSERAEPPEAAERSRIRPQSGTVSESRHDTSVDFPAPEGPDSAVTVAGRTMPEVGLGAQASRERTPTPSRTMSVRDMSGHGRDPAGGRASASSMISKAAREAVTPFAEAWNCAPTWRRGSKTSGASMMTASP